MTQNSTKLHSGPSCCDQGSQGVPPWAIKLLKLPKLGPELMGFSIKVWNTLNPFSIKNTETSTHIRMLYRNDPLARWRARRCAPLYIYIYIEREREITYIYIYIYNIRRPLLARGHQAGKKAALSQRSMLFLSFIDVIFQESFQHSISNCYLMVNRSANWTCWL